MWALEASGPHVAEAPEQSSSMTNSSRLPKVPHRKLSRRSGCVISACSEGNKVSALIVFALLRLWRASVLDCASRILVRVVLFPRDARPALPVQYLLWPGRAWYLGLCSFSSLMTALGFPSDACLGWAGLCRASLLLVAPTRLWKLCRGMRNIGSTATVKYVGRSVASEVGQVGAGRASLPSTAIISSSRSSLSENYKLYISIRGSPSLAPPSSPSPSHPLPLSWQLELVLPTLCPLPLAPVHPAP